MKFVSALIKSFKINDVREALADLGVDGMTVSDVKGFGRQQGVTEMYRGAEYSIDFLPKSKIELLVDDARVDQVLASIRNAANTGSIGDGKIFVLNLEQVTNIETHQTKPNETGRHWSKLMESFKSLKKNNQ